MTAAATKQLAEEKFDQVQWGEDKGGGGYFAFDGKEVISFSFCDGRLSSIGQSLDTEKSLHTFIALIDQYIRELGQPIRTGTDTKILPEKYGESRGLTVTWRTGGDSFFSLSTSTFSRGGGTGFSVSYDVVNDCYSVP